MNAADRIALLLGRAIIRAETLQARNAELEAELPKLRQESERLRAFIDPATSDETQEP